MKIGPFSSLTFFPMVTLALLVCYIVALGVYDANCDKDCCR